MPGLDPGIHDDLPRKNALSAFFSAALHGLPGQARQ
jgi:hypothetical protein